MPSLGVLFYIFYLVAIVGGTVAGLVFLRAFWRMTRAQEEIARSLDEAVRLLAEREAPPPPPDGP